MRVQITTEAEKPSKEDLEDERKANI